MTIQKGSHNEALSRMMVGERRFFETTIADYAHDMRTRNTPKSRRPSVLKGREFTSQLYTAVSASKAGDIVILICITRTA
jgi:hypothetical protein